MTTKTKRRTTTKGHRCEECDRLSETTKTCGLVEDGRYQTYDLCDGCRDELGAWVEMEF
ncbi:MAG: hypothetical protein AMXMBFR53_36610 [Gemmatimonadota bacterium]